MNKLIIALVILLCSINMAAVNSDQNERMAVQIVKTDTVYSADSIWSILLLKNDWVEIKDGKAILIDSVIALKEGMYVNTKQQSLSEQGDNAVREILPALGPLSIYNDTLVIPENWMPGQFRDVAFPLRLANPENIDDTISISFDSKKIDVRNLRLNKAFKSDSDSLVTVTLIAFPNGKIAQIIKANVYRSLDKDRSAIDNPSIFGNWILWVLILAGIVILADTLYYFLFRPKIETSKKDNGTDEPEIINEESSSKSPEELDKEIRQLIQENEMLQEELTKLNGELRQSETQKQKALAEAEAQKQKAVADAKKDLQKQINGLKKDKSDLDEEKSRIERDRTRITQERDSLKEQLKDAKSNIETLTKNQSEYTSKLRRYPECKDVALRLSEVFKILVSLQNKLFVLLDKRNQKSIQLLVNFIESRNIKFPELDKFSSSVELLGATGFVLNGSMVSKRLESQVDAENRSSDLLYAAYTNYEGLISDSITLLRNLKCDLKNKRVDNRIADIENQLVKCLESIGFEVTNVQVGTNLLEYSDVEAVEFTSADGVEQDLITEIVSTAVNYGGKIQPTKVKVNQ